MARIAGLAALLALAFTATAQAQPNVLVMVTDDQRYDSMGVMDRTTERFTASWDSAYATTPLCCPSRASILTGQYAHNHGVLDNQLPIELDPQTTWPVALSEAGYRTMLFGKYLNAWPTDTVPPGFARWQHIPRKGLHQDTKVGERVGKFVKRQHGPWAAMVAFRSPHTPYTPQFKHARVGKVRRTPAVRENDLSDKPGLMDFNDLTGADESLRQMWQGQRRELLGVDKAVGRIFRALGKQRQNTLVIFTSDNGYLIGEHELTGKNLPYLDSAHVPLLARGPGIPEGKHSNLVANVDIAPTIYEATGVTPRVEQDGRSLTSPAAREWLYLQGPTVAPWDAYLSDERQYIRWDTGYVEDYDLINDPWQLEAGQDAEPWLDEKIAGASTCSGPACP
jgi:arylsulfatase A-like enzyme